MIENPHICIAKFIEEFKSQAELLPLVPFESGFDIEFDAGSRFKSIFFHSNFFASRSMT